MGVGGGEQEVEEGRGVGSKGRGEGGWGRGGRAWEAAAARGC